MPEQVWLVTGASSGIGRGAALAAAAAGEHLVLAARARGPLDDTARECEQAGAASALVVPTDVGSDAEVSALVDAAMARHGRLDAVLSCAGVVAYGRTEDVPPEVFDGVLRTNVTGSVNLARHTVPVLRAQGAGVLLLVGSIIGHVAVPTMSPYVLSKWGVRALARQLRVENRDVPGVRIRYVAPGGVDTPIYDQAASVVDPPGRPPPPATSGRRAGGQVARRVHTGWLPDQLSVLNYPLALGFAVAPRAYDALIRTVFPLGATDLTRTGPHGPGNVLEPRPELNALEGGHPGPWSGLWHNIRTTLRRRLISD